MRLFSLQPAIKVLLFDIDNTLYVNKEYVDSQIKHLIWRFALYKQLTVQEAERLIEAEKERYAAKTGGKKNSLGNIMCKFGVSLQENARWRDEMFEPEAYLGIDDAVVDAVRSLAGRFSLAAVTNNTVAIGRRTLAAIGLADLIPAVVGLDTCFVSKPAAEPYQAALALLQLSPRDAVSIGDRYSVDLEIPISMGMGGILIEKLTDIYALPDVLPAN